LEINEVRERRRGFKPAVKLLTGAGLAGELAYFKFLFDN
jgi:hypothetical protein